MGQSFKYVNKSRMYGNLFDETREYSYKNYALLHAPIIP